jgi:hypothetical protein
MVLVVFLAAQAALYAPPAAATDGSGWKILLEMRKQLIALREQLDTAREGVRLYRDIKQMSEKREKGFDVVNNPLFKEYVLDIGLDGEGSILGTANAVADIDYLIEDIDHKIARTEGADRAVYERQREILVTQRNLQRLKRASKREFDEAVKDNPERESSNKTAGATTGMFNLMLLQREKDQQQEANNINGIKMKNDMTRSMANAYQKLGEDTLSAEGKEH